jgi:hypothetical protein
MAGEKTVNADVLIEIGPVNSLPATDQTPVPSFVEGPVGEPRVPGNGNRQGSAVDQIHDQCVVCHPH